MASVLGLALLFGGDVVAQDVGAQPPYRFYLDGELLDTEETMVGLREDFDVGSRVFVNHSLFPIGPGREFHFISAPNGTQLEQPDGSRRWVSLAVTINERIDPPHKDDLAALTRDEVAGLWKLSIYDWTPSCSERINWIDAAHTQLSISAGRKMGAVPTLPQDLRYLELSMFKDWSALRNLRELRTLTVEHAEGFDANLLVGMTELRDLTIHARKLINVGALAKLKRLQRVTLSYVGDFESLDFAASLPGLERLDLYDAGRERTARPISLRPLAGLKYLKSIHAQGAPVAELPSGGLPSLHYVDVTRTHVGKADLAAFLKARPDVEVYEGATNATAKIVAGANRARLYQLDDSGKRGGFVDIDDAGEIAELLSLFQIDDTKNGICGCSASRFLQLFRGEALLEQFKIACGGGQVFGRKSGGWLTGRATTQMDRWLIRAEGRIP